MNHILKLATALVLACASPALAQQAMMDVAPTTIQLEPGASGLFYITNHGGQTIHVQVEALDWSQKGGADQTTPSDSLFASPPLAEIAPGARQTVRLLASPGNKSVETTHRLMVSQLPEAAAPDQQAIRVLLQFSVPVFVGPEPKDPPALAWDATLKQGGYDLAVRNNGNFAVKCVRFTLSRAGQAIAFDPGAVVYVLPHSIRHFPVTASAGTGALHLSGHDQRTERDFSADLTPHS